ncbi:MAG TPA: hypothetical protein VM388_01845 [Acidimicrobiales bacterium]|nr:hypothetical protein [Acidimicrobiales bacterium]
MNINKRARIVVGALALAGTVAFAGNAFTATGVSRGANFGESQFVGGTVTQTVTGATLESVVYNTNIAGTEVNSVEVTFASGSDGQGVKAKFGAATAVDCGNIDEGKVTCIPADAPLTGLSSLDITVGAPQQS